MNQEHRVDLTRLQPATLSRRMLLRGVLGASMAGILAACGGDADDDTAAQAESPTVTAEPDSEPTTTEAGSEPAGDAPSDMQIVTDASGEAVEIPANPQRIAVANERVISEMLVAVGLRPVAAASLDEYAPFLVEALGGVDDITNLGSVLEIDIEALAAADPDLIIVQDLNNFGDPELLERAREIAPTVQIDAWSNVRDLINQFGAIFGEDRSAELHRQVDAAVDEIASSVPDPSSITVSSIFLRPESVEILTHDDQRLHARMLHEAGFQLPEAQDDLEGRAEFSLEELRIVDADVLFMVGFFGDSEDQLQEILDSPLWQGLSAVQRGNVIEGDFRYWSNGGPLSAERVAADMVAGFSEIGLTGDSEDSIADTRTVEHAFGTTEVPADPQAIAALEHTIVANLVSVGIQPAVMPSGSVDWLKSYGDLVPAEIDIDSIPTAGENYEPDLEAIAAEDPDLILVHDYDAEAIYDNLTSIAPTVVTAWETNGAWQKRFDEQVAAIGREDDSQAVRDHYQDVIDSLPDAVHDLTVAFIRPASDGQFRLDSLPDAFAGSVLESADIPVLLPPEGIGEVAEGSGFVSLSEERIGVLEDADLIVVADWAAVGLADEPGILTFERNPLWERLPAVQAEMVISLPGSIYNGGNYLAAELILRAIAEAVE